MIPNRIQIRIITAVLLCLFSWGCSSHRQIWYKDGGTQREFDLDAKECEIIAEQNALLRSENGKRYYPGDYAELYQHCLSVKGWGLNPPQAQKKVETPSETESRELGSYDPKNLSAFGLDINLPLQAVLLSKNRQNLGLTDLEAYMFQADNRYINIVLQQTTEAAFTRIDYPVNAPFQLYDSGTKENIAWAAFWGKIENEWVKGIGAYLNVSRHQRVVIAVTAPMGEAVTQPPEDLNLAENQYKEMKAFGEQWRPWLEENAPQKSFAMRMLKIVLSPFKVF